MATHSIGGNTAAAYCRARPERVAAIMSSGTHFDGVLVRPFLPLDTLTYRTDEPSQVVAFFAQIGLSDEIALGAAKWPAYARCHNAEGILDFIIGAGYTRIKAPMLLLHGNQDPVTPLGSLVNPIQQAVPSWWLQVLKRVKHFQPPHVCVVAHCLNQCSTHINGNTPQGHLTQYFYNFRTNVDWSLVMILVTNTCRTTLSAVACLITDTASPRGLSDTPSSVVEIDRSDKQEEISESHHESLHRDNSWRGNHMCYTNGPP